MGILIINKMQSVHKVLARRLLANNSRSFGAAATFRVNDLSIEQAEIRKIKPHTLNG